MARTPYTVNLERYICSEIELIREMNKSRDFSQLIKVLERIQYHGQSMEDAIYAVGGLKYRVKDLLADKELSDKQFRKHVKKAYKAATKEEA